MTTRKAGGSPPTGGRKRAGTVKTATTSAATGTGAATPATPAEIFAPAKTIAPAAATATPATSAKPAPLVSATTKPATIASTSALIAAKPALDAKPVTTNPGEAAKPEAGNNSALPVEAAKPVATKAPTPATPSTSPKPEERPASTDAKTAPANAPRPQPKKVNTSRGGIPGVDLPKTKPSAPATSGTAPTGPKPATIRPVAAEQAAAKPVSTAPVSPGAPEISIGGLFDKKSPVTGTTGEASAPAAPEKQPAAQAVAASTTAPAVEPEPAVTRPPEQSADPRPRGAPASLSTGHAGYGPLHDQNELWARNVSIATRGVTELNSKLFDLMRSQTDGAIGLWRQLLGAGSMAEAVELQTRELRRQFEATSHQLKDIAQTSNRLFTEVLTPPRSGERNTKRN